MGDRARRTVVCVLFATVVLVRINATKGYVTYWAKYNYTGYEGGTVVDSTLFHSMPVELRDGYAVLLPEPRDYSQRLRGLHREVWEGVEPQEYVRQEREAWQT